jgi:hypothetical protein
MKEYKIFLKDLENYCRVFITKNQCYSAGVTDVFQASFLAEFN